MISFTFELFAAAIAVIVVFVFEFVNSDFEVVFEIVFKFVDLEFEIEFEFGLKVGLNSLFSLSTSTFLLSPTSIFLSQLSTFAKSFGPKSASPLTAILLSFMNFSHTLFSTSHSITLPSKYLG